MLRADQERAAGAALSHPSFLLIGPMGSGKTLTTLSTIHRLKFLGDERKTLVVAPVAVARDSWPSECKKWEELGLTCEHISGSAAKREAIMTRPADIFTISYELIPWLQSVVRRTKRMPFGRIVFDESQRLRGFRLNGHGASRAFSAFWLSNLPGVSCWLLTGTPRANRVQALWPQMFFVDRGETLGTTMDGFSKAFCTVDYAGRVTATLEGKRAITRRMQASPRVVSIEAPPVPDPQVSYVPVSACESLTRAYKQLKQQKIAEIEAGSFIASNPLVLHQMLSQMLAGGGYIKEGEPGEDQTRRAHIVSDYRLQWIADTVEDSQEPCIVVFLWRWQMSWLLAEFKKRKMKAKEFREKGAADAWNNEELDALLIHPDSAGYGVNLQQGGRRYVFCQPMWNNEQWMQTIERAGPRRQQASGFNRTVYISVPFCPGTIEEKSIRTRADREIEQQELIDALRE